MNGTGEFVAHTRAIAAGVKNLRLVCSSQEKKLLSNKMSLVVDQRCNEENGKNRAIYARQ